MKPIAPTEFQANRMKASGIHFPFLWVVVGDFSVCFGIRNILTGEYRVVDKE